ncbi:MAG: FeoB-associated Cys-rich membrane protein [Bacteroidales bacterium]|nr:FeoB-associated Cys-rich membrane protein [Bacteroidales bacterium]
MNWQSIFLLALVLAAFGWTVRYIVKKNRRNHGCGSCNCCGETKCSLRNSPKQKRF